MKRLTYLVCVCFLSSALLVGCGEKKSDEPEVNPADTPANAQIYDSGDATGNTAPTDDPSQDPPKATDPAK
jgi:hypothetical protein